jgi:hypothetical protein
MGETTMSANRHERFTRALPLEAKISRFQRIGFGEIPTVKNTALRIFMSLARITGIDRRSARGGGRRFIKSNAFQQSPSVGLAK